MIPSISIRRAKRDRQEHLARAVKMVCSVSLCCILFSACPVVGVSRADASVTPDPLAGQLAAAAAADVPSATENANTQIQAIASSTYSNVFGGTVLSDNGTHITVFLTSLSSEVESAFSNLAPAGAVSFATTRHSESSLMSVHTRVTAEVTALQADGIDVVSWFPGVNGDGMEHIGVVGLTPSQLATLDRAFGADNIVVSNVPENEVPTATIGRNSDSAPWNGGDAVSSSGSESVCSTGVGIVFARVRYMLTASHCFSPGTKIYNGFTGSGAYVGTDYANDWLDWGDDTALLAVSPSDLVWTGAIGSPLAVTTAGWASSPDGDRVCNEGAISGQVCSMVVNNFFGCLDFYYPVLDGKRHECNLVWSEATNSGIANESGDSGGPVVRYIDGKLYVVGIVSAGGGYEPYCVNNILSDDMRCYNDLYYTAMDEILRTEYPYAELLTDSNY